MPAGHDSCLRPFESTRVGPCCCVDHAFLWLKWRGVFTLQGLHDVRLPITRGVERSFSPECFDVPCIAWT